MRQYLQVVSGTENAINQLSSVGNRYRDGWGLVSSARIVRTLSSSRRRSIFGKQYCKRTCKLSAELLR